MEQTFTAEQILGTGQFSDFYKAAVAFCAFIENNGKLEFLQTTRQHLLKLYDTALKLQWVDLQSNVEYDDQLDAVEFERILFRLEEKLEDFRYYWHVFDPANDKDPAAVCGDLMDDLSDIYQDLKYSIMIFNLDKQDCKENALWQFKFGFEKHWGYHCIKALGAIHFYLQKE